jgi:hypothetical protein
MDFITEPERKTPIVADADVVVCGGGFAGVAAALSAARLGVKVLLLEKYGFLGGLVTSSLVITTPPLNNGINIGIAERLKKRNVYKPCKHSGPDTEWLELRAVDPEAVKYEFIRMLIEQGVDILLHTYIVGVVMSAAIEGVIMENKAGRQGVLGKVFVDATGDADIAALAKAPLREVKKPMTMMYNLVGVDTTRVLDRIGNWSNLKSLVKEAVDKGELAFDLGIQPGWGAPGVHAEELVYDGQLNVWSGMLTGLSGIDPRDLTKAEIITREHVMRLTDFLKSRVSGFERSRIECTATQVGVRASRQIIGEASPSMNELKSIKFDDTVAKPYAENPLRLPYGCILPQRTDNLLVAGRCISAEEDALGQLRLWPVCSVTGQAAGVAAALSVRKREKPKRLDLKILQKTLLEQEMALDL